MSAPAIAMSAAATAIAMMSAAAAIAMMSAAAAIATTIVTVNGAKHHQKIAAKEMYPSSSLWSLALPQEHDQVLWAGGCSCPFCCCRRTSTI